MFNSNTDREWEKFGATDPYFGVITTSKYRMVNMSEEDREDFFRSGHDYIKSILESIKKHVDPSFAPKKALDFGCGVGRLVIPLAKVAEDVVGVDVSDSMLSVAKANCEQLSIKNATFIKSDDELSLLTDTYDLIHSFIVFQHIPARRGMRIFENLLTRLQKGGVCVAHFVFENMHPREKIILFLKEYIPFSKNIMSLAKGRRFFSPHMQMNIYNMNRLLQLIQEIHVQEFHAEYRNHSGRLGIILFFSKP